MNSENGVCISGGATGADTFWNAYAFGIGHHVINYSFKGHKTSCSRVVILSDDELSMSEEALQKANKTLKRSYPSKSEHVNNLLRRNWYQINGSDKLYAIAKLNVEKGTVEGGTAWAVQMFIDIFDELCNSMFLYNLNDDNWYMYTSSCWQKITKVPAPTGVWAGVGSRDVSDEQLEKVLISMFDF
ncbi:DprA-like DNA recombination-mediator protein [Agrobacterium phage Atu_ph07]|uniref:Uncharacterized protein n=1 Tax=Agrobacterium phage Atu_ph07 TaxID=2024264 RepID=A0A223VZW8_9CAUD|nr:DprA-like DNA recombination-mediator protein [Agrobacterium phage Atu_ph07]ASV44715.1 hypothetical protein [Agrobacterium phage Atu_ph07]